MPVLQGSTNTHGAVLKLEDGASVQARLAVAADSRFSVSRRQMGIAAEMRDNGRSMMVCRVNHEAAHDQSAWEWLDYGQTLALLPLSTHLSSAVVTLPEKEMAELMQLDDDAFSAQLSKHYAGRLGRMTLAGKAHDYPLVSTYAEHFHARRFVLVGDAAVGMHPVTAHSFNFGVHSQQRLARRVIDTFQHSEDIASSRLLAAYDREHRRATRPLYLATHAIVTLYTDERVPARLLRHLGLRVGDKLSPIRGASITPPSRRTSTPQATTSGVAEAAVFTLGIQPPFSTQPLLYTSPDPHTTTAPPWRGRCCVVKTLCQGADTASTL